MNESLVDSFSQGKTMKIMFTGRRAQHLPFKTQKDYDRLVEVVFKQIAENYGQNPSSHHYITGGALGVDILMGLHIARQGWKQTLVLPYPFEDISSKWKHGPWRAWLEEIIASPNTETIVLNESVDSEKWYEQLQARNSEMLSRCGACVAIWEGERKGGTYNCLNEAAARGIPFFIIDPTKINQYAW